MCDVRLCLMIEGQEGVSWEQWMALAEATERSGLEGLFRSDHYLSFDHPHERGAHDAWATLAALASITERIRLGTLVSPAGFRHPSDLAKSVVTVDHASDGRVELGMGAGWFEREHRAFGFPFPSNAERMDVLTEQIEIVHRLWSEDGVTHHGTSASGGRSRKRSGAIVANRARFSALKRPRRTCVSSQSRRLKSAFDQPEPASVAACSGPRMISGSPSR